MKTKQQIIDEDVEYTKHGTNDWSNGYGCGVDAAFGEFEERSKLYEKYKREPEQFEDDFPKIWQERYNRYADKSELYESVEWRDWLFDYFFGDVIK